MSASAVSFCGGGGGRNDTGLGFRHRKPVVQACSFLGLFMASLLALPHPSHLALIELHLASDGKPPAYLQLCGLARREAAIAIVVLTEGCVVGPWRGRRMRASVADSCTGRTAQLRCAPALGPHPLPLPSAPRAPWLQNPLPSWLALALYAASSAAQLLNLTAAASQSTGSTA